VTVKKSGSCPGVGNDCTGAQLPLHYTFLRLAFPTPGSAIKASAFTPTATYMAYFFRPNFEQHPYDVEK
jgi:hypothetical protein